MKPEVRKESQEFLSLVSKALRGALNPDEHKRFEQILKEHPDMRSQFQARQVEVGDSRVNEIWERGLRVLLGVPEKEDRAFLELVKTSDLQAWKEFLQGAFVLKVMAESMKLPVPASFSNELTAEEEKQLFAAVRAAQAERKQLKARTRTK